MRNKFLLFCLVLSMSVFAGERSTMDAAALAAQFMNQQVNAPARRASVNASSMKLSHTRMKLNSTEPAFYVFNQSDNNGYVVVSADDRTEDVLMYSDKGALDVEKVNPNLKFWLNRLQEEISAANDENAYTAAEKKARKAVTVTAISPLLVNKSGEEIAWYQEEPYWNQCPMDLWKTSERCLTGCVATAAAQIMYKWRHPATGTGSHSYTWECCTNSSCTKTKSQTLSKDFSTVTFDWDNMLATYNSGSTGTTAQKNAVATLMYCCGIACDMVYGGETIGGSGAWTDDMGYGMTQYFGYKLTKFISTYTTKSAYQSAKGTSVPLTNCEWGVSTTNFTSYFNTELEAGRPILMGGEDSDGGHEFVCDGRNTSGYFHINWGWEGESNNYCLLSALKPSDSSYNFSSNIDALIGLQPAEVDTVHVTGVTVAPTSLTLKQGKTSTLTATVAPSNATNKTVTWSSSDSKIATVDASGVVTGVAEGSATITATTKDGNKKATCAVTVEAVVAQQYVKVTSAPADWSGEYILVYEMDNDSVMIFSTEADAANNSFAEKVTSNTVTGTFNTLVIAKMTGGYSLQVNGGTNSGKYLAGKSETNKMYFDSVATAATIEYADNSAKIISNTSVMRYNSSSDAHWFRFFKASTYTKQQPVQLYKLKKTSGDPVAVTAITATNAKDTVEIGDAIQLNYTITPDSATDQRVAFAITSGAKFATLDGSKLTGVAEGNVVVTVTALDSLNKSTKRTATYNIRVKAATFSTCAEANVAASGTALKLNPVTVVYVNGAYAYVKDASGSALIYQTNIGLKAGDVVSGIKGTSSPYNGLPELKPTNKAADWTVTAGDAPAIPAATAVPTAAEVNQVMVWKDVKNMEGEFTTSSITKLTGTFKGEDILFYNNFKLAQTFDSTKTYNITGAVATYKKSDVTTIQVYFISAEEVVAPAVPSDELLNSYAEAGQNLVYAIQVPAESTCNDIVLTGTYNKWATSSDSCAKFVPVIGYEDWYVCCVADTSSSIEAKPIQLDSLGNFRWDYQLGADAALVRGTATITPGYSNECDIRNIDASQPLLIQVNSWKVNVCAITCDAIDYTITAKFPASEIATPQLMGSFNFWATGVALTPTANPNEYTATVRALCTDEFKFNDAVLGWDNEILYNTGTSWVVLDNITFGEDASISLDFSSSDYRWSADSVAPTDGIVFNYESIADTAQVKSNVSVVLAKGGGQTKPAWASEQLRLYAQNTITVTGNTIKKIELTFTKAAKAYADLIASEGVLVSGGTSTSTTDEKTDTWTGKSNKVVFTMGSGQRAVKKIVVYLAEPGQTDTTVINLTNETVRLIDVIADQGIYQFYGSSDDNQYEGYVAMQNVTSLIGKVTADNLYADKTTLYQINGTDTTEITLDAFLGGEVTLNNKTYLAEFNFQVEDDVYTLNFQYTAPEFDPTKVDTIAGIAEINFDYWDELDNYGYKLWITTAWGSNYVYQGFFLGDNTVVTDSTQLAGTYTQDEVYEQAIYDALTADLAFEIYQSSITFTRNLDGTYSIAGNILCYGNQTIVLNLTTPKIGPAATFTLTLNSNDQNLGYVIGGGVYEYYTEVPVAAVCTQSGYMFKEWSDGGTTAGRNILVTEDITLTAYFDIFKADTIEVHDTTYVPVEIHDTTYVPVEIHDTTYVPVEIHDTTYINMIEVNSMNPTMGTAILQVYAIPESGYGFVRWTDENTDNPRTVETSETPQTFTAVFTQLQPTGTNAPARDASGAQKRIINERLYIERDGVLYDASGNKQ